MNDAMLEYIISDNSSKSLDFPDSMVHVTTIGMRRLLMLLIIKM